MLYATMDAEAGHHRRYRRRELEEKLVAAGFAIEELRFFNAVGFAGWLANKWMRSTLAGTGTNARDLALRQARSGDPPREQGDPVLGTVPRRRRAQTGDAVLSVVIPALNEEAAIAETVGRIRAVLEKDAIVHEISS